MLRKRLISLLYHRAYTAPYSSIITNYEGVTLNPKFTNEEQRKILDTLNTYNIEQLSRFDVTRGRVKSLENWRNKKGPFKSLADVLEVDGLGVKVLERLCESILADNEDINIEKPNNSAKSRRQFLTPNLSNEQITTLSSTVGLHLGPSGISWAKICRDGNHLDKWDYHDFSSSPKKMLPTDTFKLAVTILSKIPPAEIYVFEASPNISPQANKPVTMINSFNQQMELTSMLLALINTSPRHSSFTTDTLMQGCDNNVYYLKANLSARLFKTLMGSEKVSSTTIVSSLLQSTKPDVNFTLPCTPIKVENDLEKQYNSYGSVTRELLGQALLLVVTFMDLCIYKNPNSLLAVMPRGRKL